MNKEILLDDIKRRLKKKREMFKKEEGERKREMKWTKELLNS